MKAKSDTDKGIKTKEEKIVEGLKEIADNKDISGGDAYWLSEAMDYIETKAKATREVVLSEVSSVEESSRQQTAKEIRGIVKNVIESVDVLPMNHLKVIDEIIERKYNLSESVAKNEAKK